MGLAPPRCVLTVRCYLVRPEYIPLRVSCTYQQDNHPTISLNLNAGSPLEPDMANYNLHKAWWGKEITTTKLKEDVNLETIDIDNSVGGRGARNYLYSYLYIRILTEPLGRKAPPSRGRSSLGKPVIGQY